MNTTLLRNETHSAWSPQMGGSLATLTDEDAKEVISFLGRNSLPSVYIRGLILDNGICSEENRGTFYGYRNEMRELEGVAIIGHATLMEASTDRALRQFAEKAQSHTGTDLIMCEENQFGIFWDSYAHAEREMLRVSRQLLFELRWPLDLSKQVFNLRLATGQDLNLLLPVHAQMAHEQSGTDPRNRDFEGFKSRYLRRIGRGRTWVVVENDVLVFKAEVVSETAETSYLEGVWVNPSFRRHGHGRNCLAQLSRMLLWRTKSLCMTVTDDNEAGQAFAKKSGYHLRNVYDTLFLK